MGNIGAYNAKISAIEIKSKSIAPRPDNFIGKVFNFDIVPDYKVNADLGQTLLTFGINVRDGDNKDVLGSVFVSYLFDIDEFSEKVLPNEEGNYVFPDDLERTLRMICLSTTRGIMHMTFMGTYLQGATLPIIPINFDLKVSEPSE